MNILKKNWENKLLAVCSALLLWFFVAWTENVIYTMPQALNVKIENLDQETSLVGEIEKVKLKLKSGSDVNLQNLTAGDFDLSIDASNLSSGSFMLPVKVNVKNPKVQVVEIIPPQIKLQLESIETKEVNLKLESVGTPAQGYEVVAVKSLVKKVKVSGASSVLANVKDFTLIVEMEGNENANFSKNVQIVAPKQWGIAEQNLLFEPNRIKVDWEIKKSEVVPEENNVNEELNSDSERKNLMVQVSGHEKWTNKPREILPLNVLVTVEGETEELGNLSADQIKLNLKQDAIENGMIKIKPEDFALPASFKGSIVSFSPEQILVRF